MIQLLLLIPLYVLPFFFSADYFLTIFIFAFILAILATGLNLNFGFTGQLNMFQPACFGIGAYVTFLSVSLLGLSFWVGLLLAALLSIVLSVIVGSLCLRFGLRAFYFAIVTLSFSELVRLVVINWTDVTNGAVGLLVLEQLPLPFTINGQDFVSGSLGWYYTTLIVLTLGLIICWLLVRSSIGRAFASIRLNEDLAETLGIDAFRYKLLAFIFADLYAVVAGALYAYYTGFIEPHYMGIVQGLDALTMLLLGGTGTLIGPVVGALILAGLPHVIDASAVARAMILGSILILVILIMPKGIIGTITQYWRRRADA